MCGDFDESERLDDELFERFVELARGYGVIPDDTASASPLRLVEESARAAYIDDLFKAGLTRSVNDAASVSEGERMDVVVGQAIAFARLAGFLAGQFPPSADLFRAITSAMLDGHSELAALR